MKRLICIICALGFATPTWIAQEPNYEAWKLPNRLERWQGLSQNMTVHNMYVLIEEMYYLPKKSWPEPLKQILLKMTIAHEKLVKTKWSGEPVIIPDFANDMCGEVDAQIHTMVSWQNDPRFISFQSSFLGQGLAARGLAKIGEPAFEAVIEALEKDKVHATRTIKKWMNNENSFLHRDPVKQTRVQQALIGMTQRKSRGWVHAIDVLRFFPSSEVFVLLETISRTDPKMRNGQYPLRARAQKSLEYLRSH